jgi:uncharacterized protein
MDKKKLYEEVTTIFENTAGHHDFDHTQRVIKNAIHIAKKENANLEIVELAALLHDIGRKEEMQSKGKISHALIGAEKAREILTKYGLEKEKIEKIAHCIECHSMSRGIEPKTLEAKVIFDADKLDSTGAIAIGRVFMFAGEIGSKLHNTKGINLEEVKTYTKEDTAYREYMLKLRYIKEKMFTKEGKRLAHERQEFMKEFFTRLEQEIDGKL